MNEGEKKFKSIINKIIKFYYKYNKINLISIGVIIGIIFSIGTHSIINHTKYSTYATFYLQEKSGIRPVSITVNFPVKTMDDLERLEAALINKYDNGKINNAMLFGSLIILEK